MADDPASGEPSENGAIGGQGAPPPSAAARIEIESTLASGDATLADTDQTSADSDQTLSDSDQTSAERDQAAADLDQDASDEDLQAGANPAVYAFSRDVRRQTTRERAQTAADRLHTASERDVIAHARDAAARARDLAAEARDRAMAILDRLNAQGERSRAVTGAQMLIHAGALRQRAAHYRAHAADYRAHAAADRQAGAEDRDHGAGDRLAALGDRQLLARQLAAAETDTLTGTRTRKAGLDDLQREIDRCHRTSTPLAVAYIDVVGSKARNDGHGHAAGDTLLVDVVACIRAHLRTYDQITRVGGGEFVCAMPNMTQTDAQTRFSLIASALAGATDPLAIRIGYAALAPGDGAAQLIARADQHLLEEPRD